MISGDGDVEMGYGTFVGLASCVCMYVCRWMDGWIGWNFYLQPSLGRYIFLYRLNQFDSNNQITAQLNPIGAKKKSFSITVRAKDVNSAINRVELSWSD